MYALSSEPHCTVSQDWDFRSISALHRSQPASVGQGTRVTNSVVMTREKLAEKRELALLASIMPVQSSMSGSARSFPRDLSNIILIFTKPSASQHNAEVVERWNCVFVVSQRTRFSQTDSMGHENRRKV